MRPYLLVSCVILSWSTFLVTVLVTKNRNPSRVAEERPSGQPGDSEAGYSESLKGRSGCPHSSQSRHRLVSIFPRQVWWMRNGSMKIRHIYLWWEELRLFKFAVYLKSALQWTKIHYCGPISAVSATKLFIIINIVQGRGQVFPLS